jgi:dolichyl-phosphate-mannose-protein mannosyltransferase
LRAERTGDRLRARAGHWRRPAPGGLAALAVVGLALALRVADLGDPDRFMADERFYVEGARSLLARGWEPTWCSPVAGLMPAVHPPLGKWLIAAGMAVAGDGPVGWRLAGALAGTATVALVYLAGRRLFGGRAPALAAALLLAVEHLSVVQSRTAMLDVFVTFWVVAGCLALLVDRDAAVGAGGDQPRRRRPWRYLAGVLFGCALATKWSGAFALAAAIVLVAAWEVARRREDGLKAALRAAMWAEGSSIIVALALVPVAVYVASYTGAFVAGGVGPAGWWEDQVRALTFHTSLSAGHPYASSATSWLVTRRSVAYFYAGPDPTTGTGLREVLAIGNPVVFLAIVPTVVWAAWRWVRRREHALGASLGAPLVLALALWLPWVGQSRPTFLYYMAPVVPFLVLLEGAALARLAGSGVAGAALAGLLAGGAVALLVFHWPVLTAEPLTPGQWALRVADWASIPIWRPHWV